MLSCVLRLPLCATASAIAGRGDRAACLAVLPVPGFHTVGEVGGCGDPNRSCSVLRPGAARLGEHLIKAPEGSL